MEPKESTTSDPAIWLEQHGDALYRFALLRVRDREVAEELVQECLLGALRARDSFGGQASERTWLIGILKRKVVDHFRRAAREAPGSEVDAADRAASGCADQSDFTAKGLWARGPGRWGGDPGRLLEDGEFWDVFHRCLAGLSERLADAFVLRELEQMPSDEVCQVLGLTPTNLWARLHRARLGLRRCLEKNWFDRPSR